MHLHKLVLNKWQRLPIDKLIRFLPTKLDPQKAAGVDTILGITYSDIGMDFTLHVRNSILAVTDGATRQS